MLEKEEPADRVRQINSCTTRFENDRRGPKRETRCTKKLDTQGVVKRQPLAREGESENRSRRVDVDIRGRNWTRQELIMLQDWKMDNSLFGPISNGRIKYLYTETCAGRASPDHLLRRPAFELTRVNVYPHAPPFYF
ncbi:hypothetical protein EVAR_6113_1 [Eumeta japonica]|uniref:Uncharacterized protein n=1 Tax=Eumeta variegata TaxID=151549 RepID=A0A4C1TF67_EUMVA|nr:hypothetical protein EVAR_6113_1 [Eumeta japonica]